ncbi:hypothetical protein AB6A40_008453 [Gnathostoma spinigerum]|uniref:Uncharacterized protein n=1 Tax=Gnathostoma spinigerum TaxID=75299 RepID=A0ABD6EU82_9BILA
MMGFYMQLETTTNNLILVFNPIISSLIRKSLLNGEFTVWFTQSAPLLSFRSTTLIEYTSTRISTNKSRYSQDWGNGKLTGVEKYPMAGDVSSLNSSRSISAPPRKKWYRRVPESFRRIRSQQALHDEVGAAFFLFSVKLHKFCKNFENSNFTYHLFFRPNFP